MRHGAGANFSGFQLLLEIANADITPNITRQVNQDGVGTRHGVEQLGHVIVRLNLNAVRLKSQAQTQRLGRFNNAAAEGFPVKIRPGRQMGVEVTYSPIHFGHEFDAGNFFTRCNQPNHDVGHFFTNGSGACRLAMGAAKHGLAGVSVGHGAQFCNDFIERWEQHQVAAAFQLQRMAGVVDVFTGAGKVNKFTGTFQFWPGFKFGLDPVLNGFNVVVGGFFNFFDCQRIGFRKVFNQTEQVSAGTRTEGFELVEFCI